MHVIYTMDTGNVHVTRAEVKSLKIDSDDPEIQEALRIIMGSKKAGANKHYDLPLARAEVTVEVKGVPTAIANGLRRVIIGETRGQCLTFDRAGFNIEKTTDPFMDYDIVRGRVQMLCLIPQISERLVESLRFAIHVENDTDKPMTVYSGDMIVTKGTFTEPIVNPTFEIAELRPGYSIWIDDIYITEGYGSKNAAFGVCVRSASRPLDLEELPRSETHAAGGSAGERSGFVKSSLVANPRYHRITAVVPAVHNGSAALTVMVDACSSIMSRLRYIQNILEREATTTTLSTKSYFVTVPVSGGTKALLEVRDETDTIGNIITRSIYELTPDIKNVTYTCIPHEKALKVTATYATADPNELKQIVVRAVRHSYAVYEQIRRGIKSAK